MNRPKPLVLIILDGWGYSPETKANAIALARKPTYDKLLAEYPNTLIHTSGRYVGLPTGQMGNSEVGHLNIGAGRIVDQEVMRITRAVRDGSFFENPVLRGTFEHAQKSGGSVHIMGLMSDGRVHSDQDHALAIVECGKRMGFAADKIFVHALMDGRDTPPESGQDYLAKFEDGLSKIGAGRVATVVGRFYAMDRDNRWDRVKVAYEALTQGAPKVMTSAVAARTARTTRYTGRRRSS
jgi:2,3-bisphosphoglycerate-independent phosphoglycerate mutase